MPLCISGKKGKVPHKEEDEDDKDDEKAVPKQVNSCGSHFMYGHNIVQ